MVKLLVEMVPETWIIAPLSTKEQLERYHRRGWIDEEGMHLDRAFPRNSDGKPIIFKMWLRACLRRAIEKLGMDRKILEFSIIDEQGIPVEYIIIPEKPLRYRRPIIARKEASEYFEYIDGTYTLTFIVETKYPKEFIQALAVAGKIGIMARSKKGYGKFKIRIKPIEK